MAPDRIKELALEAFPTHIVPTHDFSEKTGWVRGEPIDKNKTNRETAEAMLCAALADKTLIDGELREQLDSEIKVSDELQEMASKYQADLEVTQAELASARQDSERLQGCVENYRRQVSAQLSHIAALEAQREKAK